MEHIWENKEKGITLVALVITIMILLILAGITIAQLTGNGLFDKVKQAKEESIKQEAIETMNLKINNIQISRYMENNEDSLLQYFADKLCEDNEIEYVKLESQQTAVLKSIVVGNNTSIFTKLSKYPYEFQINDELKIIAINKVEKSSNDNDDQDNDNGQNTHSNFKYVKDGLKLWYDGIDNSNTGTHDKNCQIWKDLSGNNNDGILENFDFTDDSGWNDTGLLFDGINDKVRFSGDITSNYTISLLIQPYKTSVYYPRVIGDSPFPSICVNSNKTSMYGQGLDNYFPDASEISEDEKTMITITYDGSNIKLYEDDKYISELSTSKAPSSVINAYLGGRENNDRQYKGYIYNCMIYDKALGQAQISNNYRVNILRFKIIKILYMQK